jgi:hypothetical protein
MSISSNLIDHPVEYVVLFGRGYPSMGLMSLWEENRNWDVVNNAQLQISILKTVLL